MGWFDDIDWRQLGRDAINPYGAVARQVTGSPTIGNLMSPGSAVVSRVVLPKKPPDVMAGLPSGILTPQQAAQARNADFTTGQARWDAITAANPAYAENMARYKDMSQGLNAQEMTAAREHMAGGMNNANQNAMRKMYSSQARSGVRGGMAAAQAGRIQRQGMQDRQGGEQKLLLDNYALRARGLDNYSRQVNQGIQGSLATGTGEAALGVSDRTAGAQQQINRAMLSAAQNQRGGLLTQMFGELF